MSAAQGTGPGVISGDGCAVDLYAHADGRVWTQHASMHAWSDDELSSMLAETGLRLVRALDGEEDWLLASAASAG
jgi:hypothetical protein